MELEKSVCCLGLIAVLSACGPGPDRGETATMRQDIVGGTVTYSHPEVGWIQGHWGDCTGTLIGPRTVLTAAHCVGWGSQGSANTVGTITFFRSATSANQYAITRFVSYSHDPSAIGAHDLAVLHLSSAVPSSFATPYRVATGYPQSGTGSVIFGYGGTGPSSSAGLGTKRRHDFVWEVSGSRGFGYIYEVSGPGDSGGPLMTSANGIVGVISGDQVSSPYQEFFGDAVLNHAWIAKWRASFEAIHGA